MMETKFAWTGPLPAKAFYSGFVRMSVDDDGVTISVRAESGCGEATSYKIPLDVAASMLRDAYAAAAATLGKVEGDQCPP